MPIYEFKCPACGIRFERLCRMSGPSPLCRCGHVSEKQVSRSSFRLKGGGWERDGYSGGGGKR